MHFGAFNALSSAFTTEIDSAEQVAALQTYATTINTARVYILSEDHDYTRETSMGTMFPFSPFIVFSSL